MELSKKLKKTQDFMDSTFGKGNAVVIDLVKFEDDKSESIVFYVTSTNKVIARRRAFLRDYKDKSIEDIKVKDKDSSLKNRYRRELIKRGLIQVKKRSKAKEKEVIAKYEEAIVKPIIDNTISKFVNMAIIGFIFFITIYYLLFGLNAQ